MESYKYVSLYLCDKLNYGVYHTSHIILQNASQVNPFQPDQV